MIEHRRRHSEPQIQTIIRKGSLIQPVLESPGSNHAERVEKAEKAEKAQEAESRSRPRANKYGDLKLDYSFWYNEQELRVQLQHVIFLVLGTDTNDWRPFPDGSGSGNGSWIARIVLRPADSVAPTTGALTLYERIRWLRYRTR